MVPLCGEILRKYRWVGLLIFRYSPTRWNCGNTLVLISVSLSLYCWKEIKMFQAVSGIGSVIINWPYLDPIYVRTSCSWKEGHPPAKPTLASVYMRKSWPLCASQELTTVLAHALCMEKGWYGWYGKVDDPSSRANFFLMWMVRQVL